MFAIIVFMVFSTVPAIISALYIEYTISCRYDYEISSPTAVCIFLLHLLCGLWIITIMFMLMEPTVLFFKPSNIISVLKNSRDAVLKDIRHFTKRK